MRVIYIPDVNQYYGASESMMDLVKTLSDNYGVEPIILTSKYGRYNKFADENGYENYVIGHKAFLISKGRNRAFRLLKIILRPIYYVNYLGSNFFASKKAEKVIHFSNVDLIHSNVDRNDIGAILSKKHGIKHIWHIREFDEGHFELFSLRKNYIGFMNESNNNFIAISDAVRKRWIDKGISKDKIIRIYNGIDEQKYYFSSTRCINEQVRIVMTSGLAPEKGQGLLLRAISILPEDIKKGIKVDIYGDGKWEYKIRLNELVNNFQLKDIVSFHGYISNVSEILNNYDIGIMASKAEGFGRVTVEYMMSSLLVIASNTGANSELIVNGKTGILFEYPDEHSLASCIEYAVRNKDEIKRIGENAREDGINRFSLKQCARNTFDFYNQVLNQVCE